MERFLLLSALDFDWFSMEGLIEDRTSNLLAPIRGNRECGKSFDEHFDLEGSLWLVHKILHCEIRNKTQLRIHVLLSSLAKGSSFPWNPRGIKYYCITSVWVTWTNEISNFRVWFSHTNDFIVFGHFRVLVFNRKFSSNVCAIHF